MGDYIMKEYLRPEIEIVDFATETVTDMGAISGEKPGILNIEDEIVSE
jgi:hypothetical protein